MEASSCVLLLKLFLLGLGVLFPPAEAIVVLTRDNYSLVFESTEASFAPNIPSSGLCGTIFNSIPANACVPLAHNEGGGGGPEQIKEEEDREEDHLISSLDHVVKLRFVVILRGHCSFEEKVRNAQDAGYDAVIVADNVDNGPLPTMAGRKQGIKIPAVFVSKIAGEILSEHAYDSSVECCLLASSYKNISWLVMIVSFISLLGIIAAFVIYFLVQRTRQNRHRRGSRKCGGLSYEAVKALPTHEYKCESDGISNADTCAICLEDYTEGMKLRKLPCKHSFHCSCIDAWLVNWRAFCPICKGEVVREEVASSGVGAPPWECTPLLVSNNPREEDDDDQGEASEATGAPLAPDQSSRSNSNTIVVNMSRRYASTRPPIRILNRRPASSSSSSSSASASRGDRDHGSDLVEAFRASPYFTPPSSFFFHNSAPNMLADNSTRFLVEEAASPGDDSHHGSSDASSALLLHPHHHHHPQLLV